MHRPVSRVRATLTIVGAAVLAAASMSLGQSTDEAIDFPGFLEDSREAYEARRGRLLSLEEFLARAADPDTVLLDTRSAAAFEVLHLAGAVHLEFSELTEAKLREVVGGSHRTVLIYCNNNFEGGGEPFPTKAPAAALNIPTFVALWTYGYRDVYELGELVSVDDPRIRLEGTGAPRADAREAP